MIAGLTVVVPKAEADRSFIAPEDLRKFESVTGIRTTRRWEARSTRSLALQAVIEHQVHSGLQQGQEQLLDAVVVVTQSRDRNSPCLAAEIHAHLGLPASVPAFDVNQSCDGFVYGLDIARRFGRYVLLVCVDRLRAKPGTIQSLMFSDAAACATIDTRSNRWSGAAHTDARYYTDGSGADKLCADEHGLLQMDGPAVFDFVTRKVPGFIRDYPLSNEHCSPVILCQHQANLSMMKLVDSRSGYTGRSLHAIEKWGNMSMVSIPAALAEHEKEILGKTVLLVGYGAGFCAAALAVDWPAESIANIVEI